MKSIVRKAVVLAAGKSTRIATLAQGLPKPLMEINGEAILMRNLKWLAQSGIEEAWINLHYRAELIRARVGDGEQLGLRVRYSHEREILGTAGGTRQIASEWKETCLVLYGDSLVRANLNLMQQVHRKSEAEVTIGLFSRMQHPHTGLAGGTVNVDSDGSVTSFSEGSCPESSALVNAGLYLLEPEAVRRIPAASFYDFGRDLFPQLLALGVPINSHLIEGYCLGIDTPEAYRRALRLIEQGSVRLI
ncbi:MAG TPA: nucleotidyltransferase family protein [Candidatus Binataceae bacterium]|nr:nucleotidyltransferase family protein [Candidatus Binataceae bacterium]